MFSRKANKNKKSTTPKQQRQNSGNDGGLNATDPESLKVPEKTQVRGHRKTHSINIGDVGDLHSLKSSGSFNSLTNLRRSTSNLSNQQWSSFNDSVESLHSLPDLNKGSSKNHIKASAKKNIKKAGKFLKDKNRSYLVNTPSVNASTIIEDDETDHLHNIPILPNFRGEDEKHLPIIPLPRAESETHLRTQGNSSNALSDIEKMADVHDNSNMVETPDDEFYFNFNKASEKPRGEALLEKKRKQGLLQKRNIIIASSSEDDTSTEGESDDERGVMPYVPESNNADNDNASIATNDSKKLSFKGLFRKRAKSTGSESLRSDTSADGMKKRRGTLFGLLSDMGKSKDSQDMDPDVNSDMDHNIDQNMDHNMKQNTDQNGQSSEEKENSTEKDSTGVVEYHELEGNQSRDIHTRKQSSHHEGISEKDAVSLTSSAKSEHFLKKIFNLDGLLNQGGLTPNLNLNYNNGHDEENPPLDFQEEIQQEAQVLVGSVLGNPAEKKKRRNLFGRKKNTATGGKSKEDSDTNNDNVSQDSEFFVPSHAHLAVDPFDDLQDVDNFIIDVPEDIADKPRKLRAGIQSALMQFHNIGHSSSMDPSIDTESFEGSTLLSRDPFGSAADLNRTDSHLDYLDLERESSHLDMDIGSNMEKSALSGFEGELDHHYPELGSTIHKAEGNLKIPKFHRKSSSVHGFFNGDRKNGSAKKKDGVTFQLPNFESKPDTNKNATGYEKDHYMSYKNMRKRKLFNHRVKKETAARITVHIADVLERQRFILTLCKAFMLYGAPTHRLEEYMSMTAKVLEIDGSFIYFPGCMLVSFGDLNTRTSEMKLVRCAQGLDLGKLDEVHDIYKNVVHDRLGTIEGYQMLDELLNRKPKFNKWWCTAFYGISSVTVSPWAYGGSWIDLPICLGIGSIIGFLQFVISPKNTLYSSVFEVTSSIVASFIARAIGSINNGNTFCYAAIVQSSLALILPGYIILCGSLELQSRNIVAGSVRMFYAFIYSMMLSFGITLGAALYGWIDESATSTTTCTSDIPPWYYFLFVPLFTIGIAMTNQATMSQLPMMCIISGCGYVVTYFSSQHFKDITELNATLGCFIIGLVSNIYSRMLKSFNKYFTARGTFMTVSLMLPAIFVQVPSGISGQGSVLAGINTANNIVHSNSTITSETGSDTSSLSFGLVMIQVALGISVGLYLSTIIVYPFGKKRTGLFTL